MVCHWVRELCAEIIVNVYLFSIVRDCVRHGTVRFGSVKYCWGRSSVLPSVECNASIRTDSILNYHFWGYVRWVHTGHWWIMRPRQRQCHRHQQQRCLMLWPSRCPTSTALLTVLPIRLLDCIECLNIGEIILLKFLDYARVKVLPSIDATRQGRGQPAQQGVARCHRRNSSDRRWQRVINDSRATMSPSCSRWGEFAYSTLWYAPQYPIPTSPLQYPSFPLPNSSFNSFLFSSIQLPSFHLLSLLPFPSIHHLKNESVTFGLMPTAVAAAATVGTPPPHNSCAVLLSPSHTLSHIVRLISCNFFYQPQLQQQQCALCEAVDKT